MLEKSGSVILDKRMMLGIPVLDSQLANMVRMINNLYFTCDKCHKCHKCDETARYRFTKAVHESIEYMHHHFDTEERLIFLLDFPDFVEHQKAHTEFLSEVTERCRQIEEEQDFLPHEFVDFLAEQMLRHIEVDDRAFADFSRKTEQHGKLKLMLACSPSGFSGTAAEPTEL